MKKSFHENISSFFEHPTREKLRKILKENVGEFDNLDFKENWPEISKLAKHILSIGNCNGGCIVIGVKEEENKSLNPVGINQFEEKSNITKKLSRFLPDSIEYEILQFDYEESEYTKIKGRKYEVVIVEYNPKIIPLMALKDGESLKNNRVYVRRKTESTEANYEELQQLINKRIETDFSSTTQILLSQHLSDLKALYDQIDRFHSYSTLGKSLSENLVKALSVTNEPNPAYPEEDFEAFVNRMIELKKKRIANLLKS